MKNLRIRSATGQLADYFKEEIRAGRWTDRMPGENRLYRAVTYTVSAKTCPPTKVAS